jgi:hypothetical protein
MEAGWESAQVEDEDEGGLLDGRVGEGLLWSPVLAQACLH